MRIQDVPRDRGKEKIGRRNHLLPQMQEFQSKGLCRLGGSQQDARVHVFPMLPPTVGLLGPFRLSLSEMRQCKDQVRGEGVF
jgi:hypothetical protein